MLAPLSFFMKFIYDKNIDQECHQRLEACDNIFGEKKRTESFEVTESIVKMFQAGWTFKVNEIFKKGMLEIFDKPFSDDFKCYINSTPYSMDTSDGISISASSVKIMVKLICHEANHYMFRRSKYKNKYFPNIDNEEAKEIFTIVNNIYFKDIMEQSDNGWSKFWKDRYEFFIIWVKERM